jgi:hypothetical protein
MLEVREQNLCQIQVFWDISRWINDIVSLFLAQYTLFLAQYTKKVWFDPEKKDGMKTGIKVNKSNLSRDTSVAIIQIYIFFLNLQMHIFQWKVYKFTFYMSFYKNYQKLYRLLFNRKAYFVIVVIRGGLALQILVGFFFKEPPKKRSKRAIGGSKQ